jgi:hypothetical protein
MKQVMDLVYAIELPKTFKKSKAFDQIEFWKHSMAVAFITRSLAKKVLSEAGAEFMKSWWSLSPKVASAALTHHGKGPVKGEPLTLNHVVSTANRIANMNELAHPVTTAFEDPPEEGYLDALEISQEELGVVVDTTVIGLMAAETLLRSS